MGHANVEFGVLLKTQREARRVSQSKLAERAEFDHSYVSRLESGSRMPTREAVERLARALTLSHVEEDALLAAAGFLPRDVSNLLSDEPVIGEVLDLLQNDAVPAEYRDNMRQVLRLLAEQARLAIGGRSAASFTGVAA
ncbi:MAG TPA: helix-turn-helix transcriptional regulator [Thermomicrobiales bacterium]|nr:helix-turn-helix transcriptional regulator [Thermomicrobiales bacterium]